MRTSLICKSQVWIFTRTSGTTYCLVHVPQTLWQQHCQQSQYGCCKLASLQTLISGSLSFGKYLKFDIPVTSQLLNCTVFFRFLVYFCCDIFFEDCKPFYSNWDTFLYLFNLIINVKLQSYYPNKYTSYLTLSYSGTERAIVKIGHSNLRPGSKEL